MSRSSKLFKLFRNLVFQTVYSSPKFLFCTNNGIESMILLYFRSVLFKWVMNQSRLWQPSANDLNIFLRFTFRWFETIDLIFALKLRLLFSFRYIANIGLNRCRQLFLTKEGYTYKYKVHLYYIPIECGKICQYSVIPIVKKSSLCFNIKFKSN